MAPKKAAATAPKSKAADPVAEEAVAGPVLMDFLNYCPTCGKAHGDKEGLPVGEIEQKKKKKGKDPSKNPKTVEELTFKNFRLKKGLKVIMKRLIPGWTYKTKTHHMVLFDRFKDFLLNYETPKQDLPAPLDNDNDDDDDDDEGSHHNSASSSSD